MNFFEAQDRSRRNTRRLVGVMTLAVVAVVISVTAVISAALWLTASPVGAGNYSDWLRTNQQLILWIGLASTAFVGLASLYRIVSLRQGGARVARDLGGTRIDPGDNDPLRRRLRNVVEEMALASGIPTPEVYVLDHESGINAFAAGFSTEDAAVAVTRGTLETLNRDELQGVIAHEFSHVFNGDMRLNIQLMGPMFGILAIGLLGRILLRGSRSSGRSRGKGGGAAILALGAGLAVTGYIGLLLARLIKAGVSRQREYLADASAVQFTRQTAGIAGALKKIAGYKEHSTIRDNDAEEVSHMLFASGFSSISGLLATHPPLLKRIQALDPSFNETQFNQLRGEAARPDTDAMEEMPLAGFTNNAGNQEPGAAVDKVFADQQAAMETAALSNTIGNPAEHHYQAAQIFIAAIPADIRAALESGYQVMLLLPALLLHKDESARMQQLRFLAQQLGAQRCEHIQRLHAALQTMNTEARLPVLNLALPLIKEQPAGRLEYLGTLLEQLAMQDNQLDLFEYALLRIFRNYIQHAAQPAARRQWRTLKNADMKTAAAELLVVFARKTGARNADITGLVQQQLAILEISADEIPADNIQTIMRGNSNGWVNQADTALSRLQDCTPHARQQLIQALITIALHDGRISQPESELLRAFCSLLECPLPPILGAV